MMNSSKRALKSLAPLLLTLALMLLSAPLVTTYSLKNCVAYKDLIFCFRRQAGNVSEYVGDLPKSTSRLMICHNVIKHIPNRSFFNLSNLTMLSLSDNHLQTLDKDAFQNLYRLEMLNLTLNSISHLDPMLFQGLQSLSVIDLAYNKIKVLSSHIFTTVLKLEVLNLEQNELYEFSQIAASVSHLQHLTTLRLSLNKMTSLEHGNASLPLSLLNLNISNNNLSSLGCHPTFLSHLKLLNVSFNQKLTEEAFQGVDLAQLNDLSLQSTSVNINVFLNISNVRANYVDFSGTGLNNDSALEEFCRILGRKVDNITLMRLTYNEIHELSPTSLQYCPKHIEQLDLSRNKLKNTDCLSFLNHTYNTIQVFKAEHNLVKKLESCNAQNDVIFKNLSYMSYSYNYILTVNREAFHHTPNLVTLRLDMNTIARLSRKALQNLRNLRHLRLDNNLLTDLFYDTFQNLYNLETLNLRANRISIIFNYAFYCLRNLKTLDLGGNKITQIKKMGMHGLTSLTTLLLDGNNLQIIDSSLYYAFADTLRVLNLNSNQFHFTSDTTISPFVNLSNLTYLNLDRQQPYGLILLPRLFFRGLHSLKNLRLTNNRISRIASDAFDDLTQLEYLNLEYCCVGAVHLQPGVFKNLRNLTHLIVENMGLQNFSKKVFGNLTNVQALQLNRNVMHTIDVDLLKNLKSLIYMDIRGVPLSCNCENSQLQNWTVFSRSVQVVSLLDHPCQDSTKRFYNFPTDVCFVDLGQLLCFVTAAAIFLFTVLPIVFVKLYWTLKYSYFVFRAWFGEQWRRLRDEEENCVYDAFISYNSSDEMWVMEQLVPNLEGNGSSFKLCLHHRDFEVGRNIVDNIVSAVYSSRKTICVVSRNFLQSEWCSLEIQLASYRLFDEHRDVLLLIFLESITEKQMSSYHRMRKVMLKKTYLQWPDSDCNDPEQAQRLFWNQLRRAMKTPSHCETESHKSRENSLNRGRSESELSDDTQYLLP